VSVVVSDTSPLHYLILCGAEGILPRLFRQVIIPPRQVSVLTIDTRCQKWTRVTHQASRSIVKNYLARFFLPGSPLRTPQRPAPGWCHFGGIGGTSAASPKSTRKPDRKGTKKFGDSCNSPLRLGLCVIPAICGQSPHIFATLCVLCTFAFNFLILSRKCQCPAPGWCFVPSVAFC